MHSPSSITATPTIKRISGENLVLVYSSQPQLIPLFVADIREQRLGLRSSVEILNRRFTSNAKRRWEYAAFFSDIFNQRDFWRYRSEISEALSTSSRVVNYAFAGYPAAGQLIENLLSANSSGVVLSTNYTPIVLDLGEPNVLPEIVNDAIPRIRAERRDD